VTSRARVLLRFPYFPRTYLLRTLPARRGLPHFSARSRRYLPFLYRHPISGPPFSVFVRNEPHLLFKLMIVGAALLRSIALFNLGSTRPSPANKLFSNRFESLGRLRLFLGSVSFLPILFIPSRGPQALPLGGEQPPPCGLFPFMNKIEDFSFSFLFGFAIDAFCAPFPPDNSQDAAFH